MLQKLTLDTNPPFLPIPFQPTSFRIITAPTRPASRYLNTLRVRQVRFVVKMTGGRLGYYLDKVNEIYDFPRTRVCQSLDVAWTRFHKKMQESFRRMMNMSLEAETQRKKPGPCQSIAFLSPHPLAGQNSKPSHLLIARCPSLMNMRLSTALQFLHWMPSALECVRCPVILHQSIVERFPSRMILQRQERTSQVHIACSASSLRN